MKKLCKFIFIFVLFISFTSCKNQTSQDSGNLPDVTKHIHDFITYAEVKPKCEKEGHSKYYKCKKCNKCYLDEQALTEIDPNTLTIPALAHDFIKYDEVKAKCEKEGHSKYYKCKKCNKCYLDEQALTEIDPNTLTIPALEHDFSIRNEDSISYWNTCSICDQLEENSRKPLDPNFVLPDISVIDATFEIGVGYRETISINSDEEYTVISWDESIAKMEMYYDFKTSNGYLVYGVKGGEVIFSTISKSGQTITNHKIIVHEDEKTYLGSGKLINEITLDNDTATVYVDDTTVTYTIKTAKDVDKVELYQIAANQFAFDAFYYEKLVWYEKYNPDSITVLDKLIIDLDNLTEVFVDKEHGTKYCATRVVNGDEATWVIKWDLGHTAVKYVRIVASNSKTEMKQTSYVHLNIVYPKIGTTEEDFINLLDYFLKTNSTSAILFESTLDFDLDNAGYYGFYDEFNKIRSLSLFDDKFTNTVVFGGNTSSILTTYAIIMSYNLRDLHEYGFLNGKNVLCQATAYEKETLGFYYPINDEFRALWAYLHDYEIDKEKFPYAYDILEKASAIIDEIITEGMTDFEKERAIYTWLYEHGDELNKDPSKRKTPPKDIPVEIISKTSYGIFNSYGGDCMAYSGAFHLLCNMVGVECVTVDLSTTTIGGATPKPDINHRANVVRIDDEYYFVEAFWSWQKIDDSEPTYQYLNMNYKQASKIYGWNLIENGGPKNYDYSSYIVDEFTGELINK